MWERSVPEIRRRSTTSGLLIAAAVAVIGAVVLSVAGMSYAIEHALLLGFCFGAAATGWGLFAGFGGQYSFGHAAIFGLSAYAAFFINEWWGLPPLIGLLIGSVVVSAVSLLFVIPALRLRGPYFALVTLALAEIARRWVDLAQDQTGGQDGRLIPDSGSGLLYLSSANDRDFVVWAGVLLVAAVTISWVFVRSRRGQELTAVRDEQDIASATGIDTTRVKVIAYMVSAVLTGMAGGIYAYSSYIVSSEALLATMVSVVILEVAVIGGIRSVFGPAIGAVLLLGFEELLRVNLGSDNPSAFRVLFALIFGVMLFAAPNGVVGITKDVVAKIRSRRAAGETVAAPPESAPAMVATVDVLGDASAERIRSLLDALGPLERSASAMHGPAELRVEGLTKRFGGVVVNDHVSFDLPAGHSIGIWGPNGSGKSTLINVLGGQLRSDGGVVRLGDQQVQRHPPHRRAAMGIVRASQQAKLYDSQSSLDNLLVTTFSTKKLNPLRNSDHARAVELAHEAMEAVGLPERLAGRLAGELSTGQRKRLEIARVLVGHRPRVLLLDEPTAGIDASGVPQLVEVLRALRDGTGASVMVVDHDSDFLLKVVETVLLLEAGTVVDRLDVGDTDLITRLRSHMGALTEVGTP